MEHSEQVGVKRHARRADRPGQSPVWAGDPTEWDELRRRPRPRLLCPEPGCTVELASYQNDHNSVHQRFFKYKPGSGGCHHWTVHGDGGGPVSPRHVWLQNRLANIARHLGYTATCEHPATRADVFVHEPAFCLEVQLRPTAFAKRTAARQGKDAQVCWLISNDVNTPAAKKGLFDGPAVRVRVVDKDDRTKILAPWDDPQDRDLDRRARIQVYATVAHNPKRSGTGPTSSEHWFKTEPMDGYTFLREVLAGRRVWVPRRRAGKNTGLWVLNADLDAFDNWRHARRTQTLTATATATVDQRPTPGTATTMEDLPAQPGPTPAPVPAPPTEVGVGAPSPVPEPPQPVSMTKRGPRPVPKRRWWQIWRHRPR